MKADVPLITPYNQSAILIDFRSGISEMLLEKVLLYKQMIMESSIEAKLEVISSYDSLLVIYPYAIEGFYNEIYRLESIWRTAKITKNLKAKRLVVPVCYHPSLAPDLELVCHRKQLSKGELVALHTGANYRVYLIGFLPGFLYLGGLDKRLEISRKAQPRMKIKAGSVGIGGDQTGIYPRESPGGWQLIGRCPLPLFDPRKEPPTPVTPGDYVRFREISLEEYKELKATPPVTSTLLESGM